MPALELTDIGSVRQFMQKSIGDKLQDEDLEILILQASEEIERHCNREFGREDSTTRSFELLQGTNALELIDLKPYEYRALHEVVLDPDLTPVTLTAVQYREWPFPSRDGTFFGLRLAELPEAVLPAGLASSPAMPYQTRRIDVKADWGLASTPLGLQHWANVTVEAWAHLRRGTVPGQRQAELGEGPMPTIEDLPVPVRWGLKRWVRPTPEA